MTYTPAGSSIYSAHVDAPNRCSASTQHRISVRTLDIASLGFTDEVTHSQVRVPTLALFDQAFAAFAHGTLLQGTSAPIAIEDLQPGDDLLTDDGSPAKVLWIASSLVSPSEMADQLPLIRVMADSFGMGKPSAFVTVGPAARLFQTPHRLRAMHADKPLLTHFSEFVDGVNVIEVTPPTPVRLFHVCLDRHAIINAGGMMVESHHPDMQRVQSLSNTLKSVYLSMFPHISQIADFGPLSQTRAPYSSNRQGVA